MAVPCVVSGKNEPSRAVAVTGFVAGRHFRNSTATRNYGTRNSRGALQANAPLKTEVPNSAEVSPP